MNRIVLVTRKAVKLPYQHHRKLPLCAVLDHTLEIWTLIRPCRNRTVNIMLDNTIPMLLAVTLTFPELTFDTFFTLVV